jgi:hypothetical protein
VSEHQASERFYQVIAEIKGCSIEQAHQFHEQTMLESRIRPQQQCDALMNAGWTWEIPASEHSCEPWQLKWRRPSRRPGTKGLLVHSTNQAYQRLRRERPELKLPDVFS